MKFLAIGGSLRARSTNSLLLAAMADAAPDDMQVEIFGDLGKLPIFSPDEEGERLPPVVAAMLGTVRRSDGIIIACPEYAHGIPGGLKNALDWMVSSDVAVGKPAILVHASPRSLHARVQLAEVMRTMSFRLSDAEPLEIPLLGRTPQDCQALLAEPQSVDAMRQALSQFRGMVLGAEGT